MNARVTDLTGYYPGRAAQGRASGGGEGAAGGDDEVARAGPGSWPQPVIEFPNGHTGPARRSSRARHRFEAAEERPRDALLDLPQLFDSLSTDGQRRQERP